MRRRIKLKITEGDAAEINEEQSRFYGCNCLGRLFNKMNRRSEPV